MINSAIIRQNSGLVSMVIEPSARTWTSDRIYSPGFVEAQIRRALTEWGLGQNRPDAPLADLIPPGSRVLVKPNWVAHLNYSSEGTDCLYTHPEFLMAALKETLAANPSHVVVGDAPIQGCDFDALVSPELRSRITALGRQFGVPVEIVDFRRTIMTQGALKSSIASSVRDSNKYVLFDLGRDSLLEPLCGGKGFRVGDYDPRELARTHLAGQHQYLLCREAFESDVIISLPKLKTHCKAGMTGALKNLVGLNGNKDYLPHYRAGGSSRGGDNYEGWSIIREISEKVEDAANMRLNSGGYPLFKTTARALRFISGGAARMGGGWYGNDTVWRMVLDLNRILVYGRPDGTLGETPCRTICSLTDALICGQGDGPLYPRPCPVGAVSFGVSAPACDLAHAALLRLDPSLVPLLREAAGSFRWPLANGSQPRFLANGMHLTSHELARTFGVNADAPLGWRNRIEWAAVRSESHGHIEKKPEDAPRS